MKFHGMMIPRQQGTIIYVLFLGQQSEGRVHQKKKKS